MNIYSMYTWTLHLHEHLHYSWTLQLYEHLQYVWTNYKEKNLQYTFKHKYRYFYIQYQYMFVKGAYTPYLNKLYNYIVFPLNLILNSNHSNYMIININIYSIHEHYIYMNIYSIHELTTEENYSIHLNTNIFIYNICICLLRGHIPLIWTNYTNILYFP